jgi:hypothetical protein
VRQPVPVVLAAVVVLLPLAGCAAGPQPGTADGGAGETPGPAAPGPAPAGSTSTGPAVPGGGTPPTSPAPPGPAVPAWGTWTLEAEGEPGDWLLAYQPFPSIRTRTSFSAHVEARAEATPGTAVGLLVFAPQVTSAGPTGIRVADDAHLRALVDPFGREVSWTDDYELGDAEGNFTGMLVAVSSTSPWSLSVRIDAGDGGPATGTQVVRGTGTRLWHATGIPATGTVTLDAEVPAAGWTHLMVPVGPCPRSGTRDYDIRFPGGAADQRQGEPIRLYDFMGSFQGVAGTLHASVRYTDVAWGTSLALFHMPAPAAWPSGLDLGPYRRLDGEPACA